MYRQLNSGNFLMSFCQLSEAEMKIRVLSLLKFPSIVNSALLERTSASGEEVQTHNHTEDFHWLTSQLTPVLYVELIDQDDVSIIMFVAAALGRGVSSQNKCDSCKSLCVEDEKLIHGGVTDDPGICVVSLVTIGILTVDQKRLIDFADRGRLKVPSEFFLFLCAITYARMPTTRRFLSEYFMTAL